jgi:hypothetical protein
MDKHAIPIFILCPPGGEHHRDELAAQLAGLVYARLTDVWHEAMVPPGDDRLAEIERRLRSAEIILVIVTKNWPLLGDQLKLAMERQAAGVRLIPVLAAPTLFPFTPFADLQPLPLDLVPVSTRSNVEEGWYEVALGVKEVIERMRLVGAHPDPRPRPSDVGVRILFLAARPSGAMSLAVDKEYGLVRGGFHAPEAGRYVDYPGPVPVEKLIKTILAERPTVVHFSGHGDPAGRLQFADAEDDSDPVAIKRLAGLFGALNTDGHIRCVVLNACYSREQADALRQHVDVAIGVANAIPDEVAIRFSDGFYVALAQGKGIKTAFGLGCAQAELPFTIDTGPARNLRPLGSDTAKSAGPAAVLLHREGVDPEITLVNPR